MTPIICKCGDCPRPAGPRGLCEPCAYQLDVDMTGLRVDAVFPNMPSHELMARAATDESLADSLRHDMMTTALSTMWAQLNRARSA